MPPKNKKKTKKQKKRRSSIENARITKFIQGGQQACWKALLKLGTKYLKLLFDLILVYHINWVLPWDHGPYLKMIHHQHGIILLDTPNGPCQVWDPHIIASIVEFKLQWDTNPPVDRWLSINNCGTQLLWSLIIGSF